MNLTTCNVWTLRITSLLGYLQLIILELELQVFLVLFRTVSATHVEYPVSVRLTIHTEGMEGDVQDICARHSALCFYLPHTPSVPGFFMRFSHTRSGSALDSRNLTPAPRATTVCMVAFSVKGKTA